MASDFENAPFDIEDRVSDQKVGDCLRDEKPGGFHAYSQYQMMRKPFQRLKLLCFIFLAFIPICTIVDASCKIFFLLISPQFLADIFTFLCPSSSPRPAAPYLADIFWLFSSVSSSVISTVIILHPTFLQRGAQ